MADFQSSTHRARWIFTPEELAGKYKAANQRAMQTLEKYGATLMEVDVDGTLSNTLNPKSMPIPVQNPLALKRSNLCEYFMRINFKKCVPTFTFRMKFRYKFPSDKDHINRKLKSCWCLSTHDESKKRDKKPKHKSKRSSNEAQT